MIRVASQLTFCSPQEILRRTVVEQNEESIITGLFSLDNSSVESAHTLFYDGIISAGFVSIKQQVGEFKDLLSDYNYIDLSIDKKAEIIKQNKPLILDVGTNTTEQINQLLPLIAPALSDFTIFEIIAACSYYPAVVLGITASLGVGQNTELLLWENSDLVEKRITKRTQIRKIG